MLGNFLRYRKNNFFQFLQIVKNENFLGIQID